MNVGDLIKLLSNIDEKKAVFISCEGGCVIDEKITLLEQDDKLILEIQ